MFVKNIEVHNHLLCYRPTYIIGLYMPMGLVPEATPSMLVSMTIVTIGLTWGCSHPGEGDLAPQSDHLHSDVTKRGKGFDSPIISPPPLSTKMTFLYRGLYFPEISRGHGSWGQFFSSSIKYFYVISFSDLFLLSGR